MKLPRLLAVSFLTLGTSFFFTPSAQAEQTGIIIVVCANEAGESREFRVGWDSTLSFFEGKGNIAALFCSIGTQGQWKTFISTTAPESTWYYNGVAPTPSPTVEPTPAPSPSPSDGATATVNPEPPVEPSPSPSATPPVEPSPEPTVVPSPSPEPSNTAPLPEPSPTPVAPVEPPPVVPETQPTPEPSPIPVPVPVTPPEPQPQPVPTPQPEPEPEPQPQPEPLPQPEPVPEPVEPAPEPAPEPVEPAPEPVPIPEPEVTPGPVVPEPAPEPAPEPPAIEPEPPVVATEDSTPEERAVVAEALIEAADGKPVTAQAIQDAGLTYEDLPPDTPVEVRQDENGNEVVITAEVAAALVVLESPAALVEAIFTDPGQALLALASIGADMSEEERAESEKIIVATVIAGQAAVNAAGMAAAAAYRRNP